MKNLFSLTVLLFATTAHAQLVKSCASFKSNKRFIYRPVAHCKDIYSGNEGNQFTTLLEADLCVVKTFDRKKKKEYSELWGSYTGKMGSNSELTSGVYAKSSNTSSTEDEIRMYGQESNTEAVYNVEESMLRIHKPKDGVNAILGCQRIR